MSGLAGLVSGRLTRGSSLKGATDSSDMYLALHSPLFVLLEQDGANEPDDGILVGEDAHHLGPPLHLAIHPFYRVVNRYKIPGARCPACVLRRMV